MEEATDLVDRHPFEVACLTWNVNEARPDPGTGLHRWLIDLAKEASLFVVALQEIKSGGGSLALAAAKDALLTRQQVSLGPFWCLKESLQGHEGVRPELKMGLHNGMMQVCLPYPQAALLHTESGTALTPCLALSDRASCQVAHPMLFGEQLGSLSLEAMADEWQHSRSTVLRGHG